MSKLSFRARALDPSKPMPILRSEDVPDLPDFASINRAVPQIPTGMEKEEESEHHLQMAISAQQSFGLRTDDHVIPTPEVFGLSEVEYNTLYPTNFKMPRQMIHVQIPAFEDELPDYDLDEEDRTWFQQMQDALGINELKFEEMIECLEKNSGVFKVLDISEALALLKLDESVVISVYDYWLQKKLNCGKSLLPQIKTEKRDGTSGNNPYIAFRRRTEKMQTRKNRKNDEVSYEKMLKLKRDFAIVRELVEKIQHRETQKLDVCKCHRDISEKRYRLDDFDSRILSEILAIRAKEQNASNNLHSKLEKQKSKNDENALAKKKRDYKKKKSELQVPQSADVASSDDENGAVVNGQSSQKEVDDHPDGRFAFKRKKGCHYYAPLNNTPWGSEDGRLDSKYKYSLVSLSRPRNHPIGFSRRRVGRGGRVIFDRMDLKEGNDEFFNSDKSTLFGPESDEEDERETWIKQRKAYQNSGDLSDDEYADGANVRLQDTVETSLYRFHEKKLALARHRQNLMRVMSKDTHPDSTTSTKSFLNIQSSTIRSSSPTTLSSVKDKLSSNIVSMNVPSSFWDDIKSDVSEGLAQRSVEEKMQLDTMTAVQNFPVSSEATMNNHHVTSDIVQQQQQQSTLSSTFTPTIDGSDSQPSTTTNINNSDITQQQLNNGNMITSESNDSTNSFGSTTMMSTKTTFVSTCKALQSPVSTNQNSTGHPTDVT